jgi:hypothetical protein
MFWHKHTPQQIRARKEANRILDEIDRDILRSRLGLNDIPAKRGWIIYYFEKCMKFLYAITLFSCMVRLCPFWKGDFRVVDTYCTIKLGLLIALFLILSSYPGLGQNTWFWATMSFILFVIWKDIITVWVHNHLLYRNPISAVRALIMTGVNGIEIVIVFAIGYFFANQFFTRENHPVIHSPWDSLYYSLGNLFGNDRGIQPRTVGYLPYYLEVFTAILFVVIILNLVISYLGNETKP